MASWRDTASDQAQADMDGLLGAVLPFAEQTLGKYGEVFSFGAAVDLEDGMVMLAVDLGEHPSAGDVLDALYETATAQSTAYRAVAIVADMSIDRGDAIRVELEHREGVTLTVIAPLHPEAKQGGNVAGAMSAGVGVCRIWG